MNVWPLPHITFHELSTIRETRRVALLTSPSVWGNIKGLIDLPIALQAEPHQTDRAFLQSLGKQVPDAIGVLYAIGDDLTINAAKTIAFESGKPLVIVPTSFSTDTIFNWLAEITDNKQTVDLITGPAETVIVNWQLIADAPAMLRGAGLVDVLAITTALLDWRYASQQNKTTPDTRLLNWAVSVAAALGAQAIKLAAIIGQGTPETLRTLLDLTCLMVQLDSQLGHRRASHGSEHLFADALKAPVDIHHADRVAAGILYATALHGQDAQPLRTALEAAGSRFDWLTNTMAKDAAASVAAFATAQNAPFCLVQDVTDPAKIADALGRSTLLTAKSA